MYNAYKAAFMSQMITGLIQRQGLDISDEDLVKVESLVDKIITKLDDIHIY